MGAEGELLVRVRAAPEEGAATESCLRTIAEALDLPRSDVALIRGATSRRKLVRVEGPDKEALTTRWPGLALAS